LFEGLGYTAREVDVRARGRKPRLIDERSAGSTPVVHRLEGGPAARGSLAANLRLLAEIRDLRREMDELMRRHPGRLGALWASKSP